MHSNRDLATTTPLTMHQDRLAGAAAGDTDGIFGGTPEHAESARSSEPAIVDEEPDELTPGPSDVNGG